MPSPRENIRPAAIKVFGEYSYWRGPDRQVVPHYRLTASEEPELAAFWQEFKTINPKNFAVYRFHLADFRPYLRDSFVDYVESLECLLVPDENSISKKFRRRGAMILGRDKPPEYRKRICERLRTEYALRSALVHGNEEQVGEHLEELVGENRRWLDTLSPVRCEVREVMKYIFRAGCPDNRKERIRLFNELMLEPTTKGDPNAEGRKRSI